MRRLTILSLLVAAFAVSLFAAGTEEGSMEEETFPDGQVTVVIPYNAGGGSDTLTRFINNHIAEHLGTGLNFVYRAGAGGAVGVTEVANAEPDGYTIGAANLPHIGLQSVIGSGDFEVDDFDFIARMAVTYPVFVTPKGSPYTDLESFIKAAKAAPGELTIGLPGALGNGLIGFGQLMEQAGIECTLVNYSGGADMLAAILGGQIDAAFSALNMTISNMEEMNLLALSYDERDPQIPDVPTFEDLGYEVSSPTSRIYLAPAGLPEERREALVAALRGVYETEEYIQESRQAAFIPAWMDDEELEAYVDEFLPQAQRYIDRYYEQ